MENINAALDKLAVPLDVLKPDPANARKHEQRSIDAIKASLSEYGQQKPIVVLTNGTVIAGNGTLEAARQLGWRKLAVVKFSDEKKAKAYALADNRTAELSDWDEAQLAKTLDELSRVSDWNPEMVGFTEAEMMKLIATSIEAELQPGDIPPPPSLNMSGAAPEAPPSHVRMVQLFFDEHTQPRFIEAVKTLAKSYGTTNVTDTVLQAVESLAAKADASQASAA